MDQSIGLIGVGLVGTALAERFLSAGIKVIGHDVSEARLQALERLGGRTTQSLDELGACSRIVLSLPNSDISAEVVDQIIRRLPGTSTVIDTTTGDPDQMQAIGRRLAAQHVKYLDATIAGSSQHVREAKCVVLVGGDEETFESCRDLWRVFSKSSYYVGESGNGARMKLAVNLVIGLNRAVLAEGLGFAKSLGLDLPTTLEIFKNTPAYSAMMDSKGQKMLADDFAPQARLAQHLKDVELILNYGEQGNTSLPLSSVHRDLLDQLVQLGHGELDNSAIAKLFLG